jgi:hypothetical protein
MMRAGSNPGASMIDRKGRVQAWPTFFNMAARTEKQQWCDYHRFQHRDCASSERAAFLAASGIYAVNDLVELDADREGLKKIDRYNLVNRKRSWTPALGRLPQRGKLL